MQTEADRNLDVALANVKCALQALTNVLIEECPGSREYKLSFHDGLRDSLYDLLKVKAKIDRRMQ